MVEKATLSNLRNAIEENRIRIMSERDDGQASNVEVLNAVKSSKSLDIEALSSQLIDIALNKIYNDVSNRKGPKAPERFGPDLFRPYAGVPKTITISKGNKKDTTMATLAEIDRWFSEHEVKQQNSKHAKFRRLVDECRPFINSDSDTLADAMKRKSERDRSNES